MRFYLKILTLIVFMTSILLVSAYSGEKTKSPVNWESFNSALSKAKKQKKPVMVDFYAEWCHWCTVMEKETFTDQEVAKILNRDFIAVRTDIEKKENISYKGVSYEPKKFITMLGIRGLPTLMFMDSEGEIIYMVPGYIKADVCVAILKYIKEGCYKQQISFDDYMSKKAKCK